VKDNEIFLSREGLENLREEIKHLEGAKRKEIQEDISRALEFGDITENAEYNLALEAQRMNEISIVRLKQKLSRAKVVKKDPPSGEIGIGSILKLLNLDSGEEIEYTFVTDDQIDFAHNKISISSPLGKAFLNHREGERVEIEVPIGILRFKILKII